MPKRTSNYNSWQLEKLTDPATASAYLSAAISDSPEMFRKALRIVAQASQMAAVARKAGVKRESLYRATSEIGNPTLDTLHPVLKAVGIKMKFEPDVEQIVSPVPTPSSAVRRYRGNRYIQRKNVPIRTQPAIQGRNYVATSAGPALGASRTDLFPVQPYIGIERKLFGNATMVAGFASAYGAGLNAEDPDATFPSIPGPIVAKQKIRELLYAE
jgi:probable addiction module antidote protein